MYIIIVILFEVICAVLVVYRGGHVCVMTSGTYDREYQTSACDRFIYMHYYTEEDATAATTAAATRRILYSFPSFLYNKGE